MCSFVISGAGRERSAAICECPSVLFQHNVEAMIWKRHYEVQTNAVKKAYLYRQWQKMRAFEAKMCPQFDCVIAVSREDREQMQQEYGRRSDLRRANWR